MRKVMIVGAVAVGLSACSQSWDNGVTALNAYTSAELVTKQKAIEGANDNAMNAWADAGCAIPYGTIIRNSSTRPGLPKAVEALCGVLPLPSTPTALGSSAATK